MALEFNFLFLFFVLKTINPFLIIKMILLKVDDFIKKVELENGITLYENNRIGCYEHNDELYNKPLFEPMPYEIGQRIKFVIFDVSSPSHAYCGFNVTIYINDKKLNNNAEFWSCENCDDNEIFNNGIYLLHCYPDRKEKTNEKDFTFYFQIKSLQQLNLQFTEYHYVLNKQNYFFISPNNFNAPIDLIGLYSKENLYLKGNEEESDISFYEHIYYRLFFNVNFKHKGNFYGIDDSNNILKLDEDTYSRIVKNKNLTYELSTEEKSNNGVHLKFKIGIYNYQKTQILALQNFNFFICLKGYQFCDIETSMKCLKEEYYQINGSYYSCYETCKKCHKKPDNADYFNNYCDECKEGYSYYINTKENGEKYKSCYKECPLHAPELKDYNEKECVSYCPRYKRSDRKCVDFCDYENFKYLVKNESMCYNYIPKNLFIFIDNYTEYYNNIDKPIIKLGEKCPNDTYDSSFDNFCINKEEDIFHFILNPNELLKHNNPYIKNLETKEIVIRAYTSDIKLDDIDNNKDKLIQINNSNCQEIIKKNYNIDEKESLIIHDVFNLETNNYYFRMFTKEGKELNYTICEREDIIIKEIYYKQNMPENTTECPKDFPYLNPEKKQCLKNCEISDFLNKNCITNDITQDNQKNNINIIKDAIKGHSINHLLDNITNGGDDISIVEKNIKYQISTSWNQNNNNNENISTIKLGNCENILKEKYNISSDIPLLILKMDIDMEGYLAPSVEYEIYNPITKEKLNLKYCKDEKIEISVPVSIDESELFKYNPNSEFYNDICSTYTTNHKTDMSLKDRQKEFLNKNMTLCENDCEFSSYNYTSKRVECKCDVKNKIKDLDEIKIDKNKLKASLNLKNLINIQVLKCYKKLFTRNGLFYNIGSYILLSIIFLYIVFLLYLIILDYSVLKKDIEALFYFAQTGIDLNKVKFQKKETEKPKKATLNDPTNRKMIDNDILYPPPLYNEYLYYKLKRNSQKKNIGKKHPENKIKLTQNNVLKKLKNKIKDNLFDTEFELNDASYIKALLYDKRTFWQYFFSLLKSDHLLFFAIIPSKDYNSKAIKICILLFSFALFFADNALFLNEDAIHNIYENQGELDIIYQIPQIIYSNIISFIIDKIIRFLSLSQDDVLEEKNKQKMNKKRKTSKKFFQILLLKYIFFFIISFIFLISFWFYISCFCFVYRNTQIHLIKDTLLSFGISITTPFIFYFLSAAFRIYSLKKRGRHLLYILSKLILF